MITKYHVCWGPDAVAFVEVPDGSDFQTGQPNDEVFNVQDNAARRAFELNYTGFRSFGLKEEYEVGEYVTFRDSLYQRLAEKQVLIQDPIDDGEAPIIQTPENNPNGWKLISIPDDPQELSA